MLLDLFVADADQISVGVSSLCIAAAVPTSTAMRWIGKLESLGYIVRSADPADKRRSCMTLANPTRMRMIECLKGLSEARDRCEATVAGWPW
ncbi:hypothetical protein [Sphingomonas sp. Leaf17]|uniref:hypothetical protein n=1 Tax=Sphingomonas sp. Leaf17 TaxID=1735683 RepID=UPI0012E2B01D|nr:hypothetical protein [Sphingomonas sp. Leaf17]